MYLWYGSVLTLLLNTSLAMKITSIYLRNIYLGDREKYLREIVNLKHQHNSILLDLD